MHNIYSYHAKFNPDIPKKFIKEYSKENDLILDPFCGCGTTLLEGLKLKRNVIGVDLSPIGILCAKVKTYKYDFEKIKHYKNIVLNIDDNNVEIPDFPNREVWFNEDVLHLLGMLNFNIKNIEEAEYRDLFYLILLSILNNCSRKRKTWNLGYIADNCLPNSDRHVDVLKLYKQRLKLLESRSDFLKNDIKNTAKCIESDIANCDISNVNLVVTSPPYPFAVDFIRYHRLALYWMGKPVEELSSKEVGARNKRNKKNCEEEFFVQMEKIYLHVMNMVNIGGYWCMTIGNTTRCHQKIDFVAWTIDLFTQNGWELVKENFRYLKQQTMAQKRIKTESVLIFKKIKIYSKKNF